MVSDTKLTATVPAAKLAAMGWSAVSVATPAPGGGTSTSLPLSVYSVMTIGVNHILYDPFSRKIMASVGSGSSQVTGNSIAAITPDTATIGNPVSIGSQPTYMSLTSDGQILYVILQGSQSVARYNMITQQSEFTYPVPADPSFVGGIALRGVAAQTGTENTIALDIASFTGNAICDFNPVTKTAAIRGQASGPYSGSCIQFLDANNMLAFDTDTSGSTLDHYTVTAAGFKYYDYSQYTESTLNAFGCFKLSGGLAFANGGGIANPATVPATQVGVFSGITGGGYYSLSQNFVPDASIRRAFYVMTGNGYPPVYQLVAYDQDTFLPALTVPLDMASIEGSSSFSAVDVIRWGQDGLAILTSTGHIYLLRGPIVVPGLLGQNTAATLVSSSATTLTHGSGNTILTLTGSNFAPGMAVTWNGSYRTTTIVDTTHVTVAIPASDLASAGTGALVAINPGASASSALTVTIN
jgi:trimeric autotransporter adhesin